MIVKKIYILILLLSFPLFIFSQGSGPNDADPACGSSGGSGINYQSPVNQPNLGHIGCCSTTPNAGWFYFQIATTGTLNFQLNQGDNAPNFNNHDVDFVLWGPFTNATGNNLYDFPDGNTSIPNNIVACSYSPSPTENFTINATTAGAYYILLITNFSNNPGTILLSQTNTSSSGAGTTNCNIVTGYSFCYGEDMTLDATTANAASYEWYQDTVLMPNTSATLTINNIDNAYDGVSFNVLVYNAAGILIRDQTFDINIDPLPIVNIPPDIYQCDDLDDGNDQNGFIQTFNLNNQTNTILGGQTGMSVTYYTTLADAEAGVAGTEISTPNSYDNIVAFDQPIYFRIENTTTHCFDTGSFNIHVTPIPTYIVPVPQVYCDNYAQSPDNNVSNGIINGLNFTSLDNIIKNGQSGLAVSYYESLADAISGTSPIVFPYENITPFNQTIYFRLEETITGCFSYAGFSLIINPLPNILNDSDLDGNVFNDFAMTEFVMCEDTVIDGFTQFDLLSKEAELLNGETGMNVSYFTTQAACLSNTFALNPALPYINSTNPQTIYVRVENPATGCVDYTQFQLRVYENPIANTPQNMEVCDDNADGVMPFDLDSQTPFVIGTQNGMIITYHLSQNDADNDLNPINSPFSNNPANSATQIFVRLENGNSGCIDTTDFWVIVNPLPILYPINDYELCDDNADGYMIFDLNTMTPLILNGQIGINVSYHYSQFQAENNQAPITTPIQNTVINGQDEIFYRLENSASGCVEYGSFFIRVLLIPFTNPVTPLEVCDDLVHDGFTEVYLNEKDNEIRANQTGTSVYYYASSFDAMNAQNQLPIPYTNVSNPQIIHYALVNDASGCTAYGQFTLEILADMNISLPSPLEVCDPDSDGNHYFNLHLKDSEIAGALVGQVNVTYHETLTDAQLGITDIPDFYHYDNIQAWSQIIYVRVENIVTGCFDTTTLELIVNPTPQINFFPEDYEICDDNYDGFLQVNLAAHLPEILGSVSASDVQVSYHHSQAEAWAEVNPIVNYSAYTNTSNPQTFWVRVEYAATNCASVVSFDLVINPLPVLANSFTLSLCDNDDDGNEYNGYVQTFELHDMDNSILNGQTGIVTYHYTQTDAQSGSNTISDPFTNSVPFVQTLWVRVENDVTGCYATTNLDVRVNPLPTPGTPNPLEACDADADGFTQFDLTDAALIQQIQNGEAGTVITFHETNTDAENNVNPLSSPFTNFSTANASQIIYARDELTATGCYRVVPVLLTANPSPQIQTPDNIEVCDDNADGQMGFDLNEVTAQILGSINPTTITVSYYTTQLNAQNGTNPIDLTQLYTNQTPNQTIWVRVENNLTGCFSITNFQLIVHPLPTVVTPELTMRLCDADATDGVEQAPFDLESMNSLLVNGQNGLIVYYFETLAQAEANDPTTWLLSPYTNTSNPQTLYVRLQNLNTGCYALTTMDLEVYALPNLNLSPQTLSACDDSFGAIDDQIGTFDLTEIIGPLTNNQTNVTTTFYLDSFLTDPIDPSTWTNFQNTTPLEQVIYALVSTNAVAPAPVCSVTVPITLHVYPQPVPNAAGILYYCMDTLVSSQLIYLDEFDALVIPDSENYNISYHLNLVDAITGNNPLASPRQMQSGNVLYAHVESTIGCSAAAGPYTITFAENPIAGDPVNIEECDTGDLTETYNLADENEANVLNGQTGMTVTFHDSLGDAEDNINPISTHTSTIVPPATSVTDTIFARLTNDLTLCHSTKSFTITLNALPEVTINAPNGIMYCQHNPIVLTAIANPTGSYNYTWSFNANTVGSTPSIAVTDAGVYTITIVNDKGCSDQATINVLESEVSTLELSDLEITDWVQNNTLTIPTGPQFGSGIYTYAIDQHNGPFSSQLVFENLSGGSHTLYVNDENNCGIIAIPFVILDYMRFFTPNGDGYNDTWNLLGGKTQPGAKIHIFDRFGKLLAVIDPNGEGWNGLYNGFQMPSTDYWFSIELEDGTLKKGHFSLIRR